MKLFVLFFLFYFILAYSFIKFDLDALRTILFHSPALLKEKLTGQRRVRPVISTNEVITSSVDIMSPNQDSTLTSPISIRSPRLMPSELSGDKEDTSDILDKALIDSDKMKEKQRRLRQSIRIK